MRNNYVLKVMALMALGVSFFSKGQSPTNYRYGEVLQKSFFFYEAQQSGPLPSWNRVSWRGNSGMTDGSDVGLDLTGGWYDAGDHVKFGFPMAYTATMLAWGGLESKAGYIKSGQWPILQRNLKFVTDYFIKCHPSKYVFYGQVGNGAADHSWWGPAEVMPMARPSYKVDAANPGTEVTAETAAALAASSLVFKESDAAYSNLLIKHSKELFAFADSTFYKKYSQAIPDAHGFYQSFSGWEDELVWAAIWLYKATGEQKYLDRAKATYDKLSKVLDKSMPEYKWTIDWDDKTYGCYILMSQLVPNDPKYKTDAERYLDFWTVGAGPQNAKVQYTPGGLAWLLQWGSLRYASNTAFMALIYADMTSDPVKKARYADFGKRQIDYALGSNPAGRSYVCGFGVNPPKNPHHRTQHGSWANSINSRPTESRHILYGALVGGPGVNDGYTDNRENYVNNEVATDYNAGFTGAIAKLYSKFGGEPLANFPEIEVPGKEFLTESKINASGPNFVEYAVTVNNRSGWPARNSQKLSYRVFLNLSEGFDAGLTLANYSVTSGNSNDVSGTLKAWNLAKHIYYAEVKFPETLNIFPGGDDVSQKELQVRIMCNSNNAAHWNLSNDWSVVGVGNGGSGKQESVNIPMYVDGQLVGGNEPEAGVNRAPLAKFTTSAISGRAPFTPNFDASTSSDPDGDAITYAWKFGDGTTGVGKTVSHTYTTAGEYTVELIVTDSKNLSSTSTKKVVKATLPTANAAPVADFSVSATAGVAPLGININGAASYDPDGDAITYAWSFGDATPNATGVSTSHLYSAIGSYNLTLTVSDGKLSSTKTIIIKTEAYIPPTDIIKALYRSPDQSPVDNAVKPHLILKNEGPTTVALKDLKVRYYYTSEGSASQNFFCDWAVVGNSNVTGTFFNGAKLSEKYVEIGFSASTGNLNPGASTGDIQCRIAKADWSNYSETDDYSYDVTKTNYVEHGKIAVYYKGQLVFGLPPMDANMPMPAPVVKSSSKARVEALPSAPQRNFLSSIGNKLFDACGKEVRLTGINWFGFETGSYRFHGIWMRDMFSVLKQIKDMGFNCIRIPWTDEMLKQGASIDIPVYGKDPYTKVEPMNGTIGQIKTPLLLLDEVVKWCQQNNLKIILDNHARAADGYMNENVWYTTAVPETKWIENWVMIANRYKDYDAVVGMDLDNEPHGKSSETSFAAWGNGQVNDWRLAAQRCGNAILAVNPNVLIVVEGNQTFEDKNYWWGGNLKGARNYPVTLSVPNKLMYSPHEYGPTVFEQEWFADPTFPANMKGIWDEHFGYLIEENKSPLLVGEFGIKVNAGKDAIWFKEFLKYMGNRYSWTFWCFNPNSGDTGGIVSDDWTTPVDWKLNALKPYMAPMIKNGIVSCVNVAPVADFTTSIGNGIAPVQAQFDASESSDENGDNLTYTWKFGNTATGSGKIVNFTFTTSGSYVITLTVSDGKGGSSTKSETVIITKAGDNRNPTARLTASTTSGEAPVAISFNGTTSTDPDSDVLTYTWDFGNGNTGTGAIVSHTYTTAGTFTAKLTVSDGRGGTSSKSIVINIAPEPPISLVAQYRANDINPTNDAIKPHLNIINSGKRAVDLSKLKVRYYITKEDNKAISFFCDYAAIGTSKVAGAFVSTGSAANQNYVEISFNATAGNLGAGGSTGDIQCRFNNSDYSTCNEANDYSFDPTKTNYVDHNKVVIYYDGVLAWGIPPVSGARLGSKESAFSASSSVVVSPNPSKGMFTVTFNQPVSMLENAVVTNVVGLPVYQKDLTSLTSNKLEINLKSVPSGAYFLKVKAKTGEKNVQKVMIFK